MTEQIQMIPLDDIDADALSRDRAGLDEEAMTELRLSIAASGLRMPIEVFAFADPSDGPRYGLISGYRRLAAFRALLEFTGKQDRYATIPAFVRAPASLAAALTAMVEENEVRVDLSPFERGCVAVTAVERGLFDTVEAAIDALYPSANRTKRTRLRAMARLVEGLGGHFATPEALSERQALRLEAALRAGYGELIRATLEQTTLKDAASQWDALAPVLAEMDQDNAVVAAAEPRARNGRPRRVLTPRSGLHIRREITRDGWVLRFSGREATSGLLDLVFDHIERLLGPA